MRNFKIVLRNGFVFDMECEDVSIEYQKVTGTATSFQYTGCTKNIPIYIDPTQIVAVIQGEERISHAKRAIGRYESCAYAGKNGSSDCCRLGYNPISDCPTCRSYEPSDVTP